MTEETSLGESVATEVASVSDSSSQPDANDALQQQAETSGQVEGQAADATQVAEGQQATQTTQAREDFEDEDADTEARPEKQGPETRLWESRNHWREKARSYEETLAPLGGPEGLQEVAEPLTRLASPTSSSVDALEAVFQIAPHLDRDDFVTATLDALPDEKAKAYLTENGDEVAKMLFGDIFGENVTLDEVRNILDLYRPDEEPEVPAAYRQRLEAAEKKAQAADEKTSAFEQEQERSRNAESARQLQAIHLDLSKEAWVTPIEHVIGKLFGELPADAPPEISQEWKEIQDDARVLAQMDAAKLPHVQQMLDWAGKYAEMATQAKTPEQKAQFEQKARRQARSAAEEFKKAAHKRVSAAKRRFDAQMSLRSSEASRATEQRAEVAGSSGGVVTSTARGPMPPYGTPAYEQWLTAGFS
jgi:hypothetical protein